MSDITAIFSDVGGVLLTNGWDRAARRRATEKFHLEAEEFEDRHELLLHAWEVGRATLEEYLDRTVFYRDRPFSREEFKAFVFAQSQPYPEALEIFVRLARSRRYLMATLNNESLELNEYRIERFRLRDCFAIFLSSCYLGVRKPDEGIYRSALRITQRAPAECVFLDDRPLNLESAAKLGMRTIHYRNPAQFREDLGRGGVAVDSA